jgi:hypothetical protein
MERDPAAYARIVELIEAGHSSAGVGTGGPPEGNRYLCEIDCLQRLPPYPDYV